MASELHNKLNGESGIASSSSSKVKQVSREFPVVTIFSEYTDASRGGLLENWNTRLGNVPYNVVDHRHPEDALASLQEAEVILGDPDLLAPMFNKLHKAKWVQGTWAGFDDMLKLIDPGDIPPSFTYTRLGRGLRGSMAEHVIGMMIAHERHFAEIYKLKEQKQWKAINYRVLGHLTIGIIGLGDIGDEIARLCKAFGMKVWGLGRRERSADTRSKNVDEYRQMSGLAELLSECDYVCNVLPNTEATTDVLSGDVLSSCAKKPVFVNVGRGSVISEEAIMAALDKGWISHAILDVFRTEPLPVSSPLWSSPQVTITPHCAANTFPLPIFEIMEENYNHYINGEPLKYAVDWELGY